MRIQLTLLFCALGISLFSQTEDITFTSDTFTLEGTIEWPNDLQGKVPALILVRGSGPSDRDQTVSLFGGNTRCLYPKLFGRTVKNFRDIAEFLAENGVAVLRYDKRTFTYQDSSLEKEIVVDDFTDDAVAAIRYMKNRSEVDTENIFVLGHSQGSGIVIDAVQEEEVTGVISMAGPSIGADTILAEQFRYIITKCQLDPDLANDIANQLYTQFNQIRVGQFDLCKQITVNFPMNPNPVSLGFGKFWESWIKLTDRTMELYRSTDTKRWAVNGDDDLNVPVEQLQAFADIPDVRTTIYPGLNHFMTTDDFPVVSQDFLDDLLEWILTCNITSTSDQSVEFQWHQQGSNLHIKSDELIEDIHVFDGFGRLLKSSNFTSSDVAFRLPEGAPLMWVQLIFENGKAEVLPLVHILSN